jgi:hypothetical protein
MSTSTVKVSLNLQQCALIRGRFDFMILSDRFDKNEVPIGTEYRKIVRLVGGGGFPPSVFPDC